MCACSVSPLGHPSVGFLPPSAPAAGHLVQHTRHGSRPRRIGNPDVLGRKYDGQNCSAARTLEFVGERWSVLILRDSLFRGMTRLSEFQRSLGMAPNVLSARLQGSCKPA